jgi:hypothetical protein
VAFICNLRGGILKVLLEMLLYSCVIYFKMGKGLKALQAPIHVAVCTVLQNPKKQMNDGIGLTFYIKDLGKEDGKLIRSLVLSTTSGLPLGTGIRAGRDWETNHLGRRRQWIP